MRDVKLEIPFLRWMKIVRDLRRSSGNKQESGAFLLGENYKVTDHIPYDKLDPHVARTGIISFDGRRYTQLWDYCMKNNLRVLADVHTHPGVWTEMSNADKTHPMISQKGHIALIVPSYANNKLQTLKGVGIFQYEGEHKWKQTNKVTISLL